MSHLVFVTCGKSIWTNSRCWKDSGRIGTSEVELRHSSDELIRLAREGKLGRGANSPQLAEILQHQQSVRDEILERIEQAADDNERRQRAEVIARDQKDGLCWSEDKLSRLPAELATLYLMKRELTGARIVLLNGEAKAGEHSGSAAAHAIQALLAQYGGYSSVVAPSVVWGPIDASQFDQSLGALWNTIEEEISQFPDPNRKVSFVVTGGYKGVLIYLVARLAQQSSLAPFLRVFYVHEEMLASDPRRSLVELASRQGRGFVPVALAPDYFG